MKLFPQKINSADGVQYTLKSQNYSVTMGNVRVVYETSVKRRGVPPTLEWTKDASYSELESKNDALFAEVMEYSKAYEVKKAPPADSLKGKLAETPKPENKPENKTEIAPGA
jgi:hypothetical protein